MILPECAPTARETRRAGCGDGPRPGPADRVVIVPIGYLITAVLVTWCTLMALAPPRRSGPLGFIAYFYGFLLNELPFLVFYYLVGSTCLAAAQTGLNSPIGWAGVAAACLSTLGLMVVALRALKARPELDRALDEGLGAGWRAVLGPGAPTRLSRRLPYGRILIGPFFMRRAGARRVKNIPYGNVGMRNLLDVYQPRTLPSNAPVFVHFHGGMLLRGRKNREALPLLFQLASQGWVCISANYRLRPQVEFPEHLIDVKKVIAWVREHAPEYGADPETLILSGTSSGGQLAALAAMTAGDPGYQPGFEHVDTSVTAVVCFCSFYGFPGERERSPWWPMSLAENAAGAPPFFVIHGDNDTVVPVEYARLFVERLRNSSANPVLYAELRGAQHSFERFHSVRFDTVVEAVQAFTTWVVKSG